LGRFGITGDDIVFSEMLGGAGLETYDEESQTSVKIKGCQWFLILGVQHIILAVPSEKEGLQRVLKDITMMRRLPKFGCGELVGIW